MRNNKIFSVIDFVVIAAFVTLGWSSPLSAQTETVGAPAAAEELKALEDARAEPAPGHVTVDFKEADIRNVLRVLALKGGVNIVAGKDVQGTVTMRLTDVSWDKALDVVLKTYNFGYERDDNIIRVATMESLRGSLKTQVFTLNYANAAEAAKSIEKMLSEQGRMSYDERTNTLVVTDIPTNLLEIRRVVQKVDKMTSQVMIAAKIIETTLGDTEKLGIDWNIKVGASGSVRPTTYPFTNNIKGTGAKFFPKVKVPIDLRTQETDVYQEGILIGTTEEQVTWYDLKPGFPSVNVGNFAFGTLDFSQFQAVLELLEARSDTKIISNPRVTTLNNQEAEIKIGQVLNIPTYERNTETGTMEITGYEEKDLGIKLTVTPHVNEEGYIVVDLHPVVSALLRYDQLSAGVTAPVFSTREATTHVMVRDGQTIAIGGLIKDNEIDYKKRVPFLGHIPILGLLFTKTEKTIEKTDLLFFITVMLVEPEKELAELKK